MKKSNTKLIKNVLVGLCVWYSVFLYLISSVLFAEWTVAYGFKKGELAYYNSKTSKIFDDPVAYGPMSFRVVNEFLWVLDSVKSRINVYDKNNNLVNCIEIINMPKDSLLEDFSLVINSREEVDFIWVGEGSSCSVYKIRPSDGKIIAKAGGHGHEKGKILQIYQIETNPIDGGVIVGDIARKVLIKYDNNGKFISEISWQGYGFAIDNQNNVSILEYSSKSGYIWKLYKLDNFQLISARYLGWHDHQNPRIYGILPSGELLVSFVPPGGYKDFLKLVVFDKNGFYRFGSKFQPPKAMNRFFVLNNNPKQNVIKSINGWLANADFDVAPNGHFKVKYFSCDLREVEAHE